MSFIYASKKAEKIAGALHRVSDFIDNTDPLRRQVRTCGLVLLECVYALPTSRGPKAVQDIQRTLKQIVSLLEVAHSAMYVSSMNRDVFVFELRSFGNYLDEKASRFAEEGDRVFTADSFSVSEEDIFLPPKKVLSKGHKSRAPSDVYKGQVSANTKKDKLAKKTSRKETLLSLIKQMGKASIKDIAKQFPDVSEKTIQRDITELLEANVLKKHGKRRWSVYFLADGTG